MQCTCLSSFCCAQCYQLHESSKFRPLDSSSTERMRLLSGSARVKRGNDWLTGWIYHGFTTMYTAKIVVNTPLDMHSMRVDGGSRLVLSRYMAMPQDVGSTLQRTKTLFSQGKNKSLFHHPSEENQVIYRVINAPHFCCLKT